MRPDWQYRGALRLIEAGMSDSAIGRELGIPRTTIRTWRVGKESRSDGPNDQWVGRKSMPCPICDGTCLDEEAYAYLLGIYLGDGCLSHVHRGVYRLRIVCDIKYPDIVNEIANHITIIHGTQKIGFVNAKGCVEVGSYWKHWPCLFPQHAPGKKHERHIELVDWQQEIANEYPQALIRGLIHSDGSRHINGVERQLDGGPTRYRYSRYQFSNLSEDIRGIFTAALDRVGVSWTRAGSRNISIARRQDVALVDTFVGPKS